MVLRRKVRTTIVPGVVTLAVLGFLIAIFSYTSQYQKLLWMTPTFSLKAYSLFWVSMVSIGSLGAYLSRRAGGRTADRLIAALFIVVGKCAGYILLVPFVLLVSGPSSFHAVYGGWVFILVKYIFAPGLALSLGAIPYLGE